MKVQSPLLLTAIAFVFLCSPSGARAQCSIDPFGPGDPVTIDGVWDLEPGCVLDFGDREVILAGILQSRALAIVAGRLTVLEQGRIEDNGKEVSLTLHKSAVHDGACLIQGLVDSSGDHGGEVILDAEGNVMVDGLIRASATMPTGFAGFISLEADGDLDVGPAGRIGALGGAEGEFPGEIVLRSTAGALRLSGLAQADPGSLGRGSISLEAARDIRVDGTITANGLCFDGLCTRGGRVALRAGGSILVSAPLSATGLPGQGDGGTLDLEAGSGITLSSDISLGSGPGRGGSLTARADGGFSQPSGAIQSAGGGGGGAIRIDVEGDAVLAGSTDADSGPDGDGGSVQVVAGGKILLQGSITAAGNYPTGGIELVSRTSSLEVSGRLGAAGVGGFATGGPVGLYAVTDLVLNGPIEVSASGTEVLAGSVVLDSFGLVHLGPRASIQAAADPADPSLGEGGSVVLTGCEVIQESSSNINASGALGGFVAVTSPGAALHGYIRASQDGLVSLYHSPGLPPDLSGASISPAPIVASSPAVDPCGAVPAVGQPFRRGDCNGSGAKDISDAITVLGFLFTGGQQPPCEKACDTNDDSNLDVSDGISLLTVLFVNANQEVPPPWEACGLDPTGDDLTCGSFDSCPAR